MNMNKTAKKIWDIATTALVVLVVILATLLVGARFIGLTPFTVLSGSMEPTYHVGSLIYVKKVDPYTLKAGDVITYSISEEMVATHRIVEVIPDEEDPEVIRFKTKGDANEAEEQLFDRVAEHYEKWKALAEKDPDWAEINPIEIKVRQNEDKSLEAEFYPRLEETKQPQIPSGKSIAAVLEK